jgi:hypothetical protein
MGRLVRVPREVSIDHSAGGLDAMLYEGGDGQVFYVQGDGYLERVAKYVPAEVLAFSVFINAMLDQSLKSSGGAAKMAGMPVSTIATGVVIAGTVLTPFFMWYVRRPGDAWATNAFVSTLLFPVWAYALGSVAFTGFWDGNLAAILLASATVVSGLFSPRLPRAKRRKERERDRLFEEEQRIRAAVAAKPHLAAAKDPTPAPMPVPMPAPVALAAAGAKK